MGMFDTIYCEYPLPDARHQDLEFQTKDLDCVLDTYTIRRDGRLIRHAGGGLWGGGADPEIEWPFHGDLSFYTSLPPQGSSGERVWVEYVVRFTQGRVEWIRPHEKSVESREEPLASRAHRDEAGREETSGAEETLLQNLRRERADLEKLLAGCSDHWGYEDPVYRFYHQSFKVYGLQRSTQLIVQKLQALAPDRALNPWFLEIVQAGTGKEFQLEDNARWTEVTRPILDGFFHARFFLEMAVRYADLEAPPQLLPSGYAALLYLFGLR